MKPNEVPDKIYVVDATFPDYVDFDGSPINTKRIDDHDIEYIRADAFIEKACNAYCKVCKMTNCRSNKCKWISDFKEHLETI